jgi:hypothetical protein
LKTLVFVGTFLFFSSAYSQVGFSRGSTFNSIPVQGEVRVRCNGFNGAGTATFTCRDVVLDPVAYDYFLGPKEAGADRLELGMLYQDGTNRVLMVGYDGTYGKTTDALNLWISTLFQKPILKKGINTIRYRTYSSRSFADILAEGEIQVEVRRGNPRVCPTVTLDSSDINDSQSQYSICQRYFEESKYCR